MSFMTRVRVAVVQWWIRAAQEGAPQWEDLEGLGRLLARPRASSPLSPGGAPASVAAPRPRARLPHAPSASAHAVRPLAPSAPSR